MLAVEQLSFSFPGRTILDQVSFQLRQGAITCLLGGNGSGKPSPRDAERSGRQSSLLEAIYGLLLAWQALEYNIRRPRTAQFYSMKIAEDVRKYEASKEIAEEEAFHGRTRYNSGASA